MLDQTKIDALRHEMIAPRGHVIDGEICNSASGAVSDVISPLNGEMLTTIASGSEEDVNRAVTAARRAFEDRRWAGLAPSERKKVMLRWADLIEAETLALTVLGVRDNGTEIGMAIKAEVGSCVGTIRYYAEAVDKIYGQVAPTADSVLGLVHHEPVGVVGAIVPWNFPLMIGAWKLAPALAAGNSVVLKPAETASLSLLRIAELALKAGLPAGVLNVVTGKGSIVGEAMALSMDIDVMVFTGSGGVGRRLLENSARSNLKRCYLELGGKSPNIIFADAPDLEEAAKVSVAGIFRNSGQVCVAGSRMLIQREIHDDFVSIMAKYAGKMNVGDPLGVTTNAGAVNNVTQLEQNLRFVEIAQSEGNTVFHGGARLLTETGGYFMEPTIITNVKPQDSIAQQEVFGPVLAVTPFEGEQEVIEIANSTDYGLSAGVWTSNLGRAHRMIRGIKSGLIHVNTYGGSDMSVPLGGVKQSGNGHDKSLHAFDKYFDLKTAWIKL
ncbi:MAG: aldehyde dehydrogenase [Rhodobacterales bacterium]|nr:aldehyde dehydrogenase [Rhodobacterales bacterium]